MTPPDITTAACNGYYGILTHNVLRSARRSGESENAVVGRRNAHTQQRHLEQLEDRGSRLTVRRAQITIIVETPVRANLFQDCMYMRAINITDLQIELSRRPVRKEHVKLPQLRPAAPEQTQSSQHRRVATPGERFARAENEISGTLYVILTAGAAACEDSWIP